MRRTIAFVFLVVLAVPFAAHAQISVQLVMERDSLLLFESIPVIATVHNFSGHSIALANHDGTPWLSFLIADDGGATISALDDQFIPQPVTLAPGHTVDIKANLLPHYDLRQRGSYTVRAVVDGGGAHALSAPVRFTIGNGREIWKQTVGLPVSDGGTNEEYRTYSLLVHRANYDEVLYVGVQDEAHDLVYGMIPVGRYIGMGEPSVNTDNRGHLHVLFRSGPRSLTYADIRPDASAEKHVVYSDVLSVPQLVADTNGVVIVRGGDQVYPHVEHVMSEDELRPPAPLIVKPPKKKHWWSSSPAKSSPQETNATSTTSATNAVSTNFGVRTQ
jgi:hypothetical protein